MGSLFFLVFHVTLRRLLVLLLMLLFELIHLQSKFVLERLYKVCLLLLDILICVRVVLGEADTP